jgi:hypothetical protein
LLQQQGHAGCFDEFVELMCSYFHGRGGAAPTKGDMDEAARFQGACGRSLRSTRRLVSARHLQNTTIGAAP